MGPRPFESGRDAHTALTVALTPSTVFPVKSTPRHRQSRLRTTERILEGARAALLERGWQGWGINAISARAGVQKVLIYRYFGGMEGLCAALAGEALVFPRPTAGTTHPPAPAELIRAVERHWREDPFAAHIARLRPILPRAHPFADAFDRQRSAFTAALEAAIRAEGRDRGEAAVHIALLLDFGRPDTASLPPPLPPGRRFAPEEDLPVELL